MPQKKGSRPYFHSKAKQGAPSQKRVSRPSNRPVRAEETIPSKPAKIVPAEPEIEAFSTDFITIAEIVSTFGLRGAVKASIRTDFPERFEHLQEAWLLPPGALPDAPRTAYKVLSARAQNEKQVVIRFEGLTKIEQAEKLRGYTVSVPRGEVVPLPEGEYYIFQLIGMKVYSEKGDYVGEVINVLEYPANDVYEVKGPLSPNSVLIPAVEDFIRQIDLENQRLTINLIEGLI
jgi:16S rRNA processing protein RimM